MNAAELAAFTGMSSASEIPVISAAALELARRNGQPVFVTLAERGIVGALPNGTTDHITSLPLRGEIDIVGAGDSVTANLTVALATGATLREAIGWPTRLRPSLFTNSARLEPLLWSRFGHWLVRHYFGTVHSILVSAVLIKQ